MHKALSIACLILLCLAAGARADPLLIEGAIHIQVKGEVKQPGVYRLRQGARGADALQAAGGLRPGAELSGLNLAAALADGDALEVPRRGARASSAPAPARRPVAKERRAAQRAASPGTPRAIALNSATLQELDQLPGIGPAIAGDILAYRNKQGGFRSLDELREVPGIGERKLSRLRPFLRL